MPKKTKALLTTYHGLKVGDRVQYEFINEKDSSVVRGTGVLFSMYRRRSPYANQPGMRFYVEIRNDQGQYMHTWEWNTMSAGEVKATPPKKKVNLDLVGLNGNAFYLMGRFKQQAQREHWTKDEIDAVLDEAKSGDYDHLLATLMEHCK